MPSLNFSALVCTGFPFLLRTDTAENAECGRSRKVFGKGYGFSLCAAPFAIPYALIYWKMIGKQKVRTDSEVDAEMSRTLIFELKYDVQSHKVFILEPVIGVVRV